SAPTRPGSSRMRRTPISWRSARASRSTRGGMARCRSRRSWAVSGFATVLSDASACRVALRRSGADGDSRRKLDAGGPDIVREGCLGLGRRRPAGRERDEPIQPDVDELADQVNAPLAGVPHVLVAGVEREPERRRVAALLLAA